LKQWAIDGQEAPLILATVKHFNVQVALKYCACFDTPDAIDIDLLCKHLELIRTNQPVRIPKFDLGSCVVTNYLEVEPNKYRYLIVEGIFIYTNERLFGHFDMNIWVETSEYLCALRRFIKYTRDIQGYSPDFIYNQCAKYVIPGKIK
jgi:uridine kinase